MSLAQLPRQPPKVNLSPFRCTLSAKRAYEVDPIPDTVNLLL